jgi:hypothetical protein
LQEDIFKFGVQEILFPIPAFLYTNSVTSVLLTHQTLQVTVTSTNVSAEYTNSANWIKQIFIELKVF